MTLEIVLVLALILANGLFAMSEMAIVAARKFRLQERADQGRSSARIALQLANNPNEFLSTVQIGITLVATLASAVGGATIAERLAVHLDQYPSIAPHGESVGLAIVVLAISYVSLILGELVPKRLALRAPEQVSIIVAPMMSGIAYVSTPLVRFLSMSTELVLRLIPTRKSSDAGVTEEEIKILIDQAVGAGTVHREEREMVEGVFWLGDRRVSQIMTPRTRMVWLDIRTDTDEILQKISESNYSTFPVGDRSIEHVIGIVDLQSLLPEGIRTQRLDIQSALKPPLVVPETLPAVRLIGMFQQSREQMAIVVDEHGSTQGIVTLTDILESIVGDIPARGQREPPGAVQREDGSWYVDGIMPLVVLKEMLNAPHIPEPEGVTTVAGLILVQLGRIPGAGDEIEVAGVRFEVVDMDGPRIDKLLIRTQKTGDDK